jgi:MFS family permease
MSDVAAGAHAPWYRALNRAQWNTLFASNLGWLFDGYETYALILVVGSALHQLLPAGELSRLPTYAGLVIAVTLLGWAVGGLIGGVLADYIGRKRTMVLAIAGYSLITGLSAFAWDWWSFAALRFVVGVAIGSEWVTGTSIMAELWPDHARGRGVGLMQCGFGLGFFLASLVWLFVGGMGPDAWRIMFLLGVAPALLTLWVRRAIPESEMWQRADERRRAAVERRRSGAASGRDDALARFTLADLFASRELRRRTIIASLLSLATTFGFWGVSSWVAPYIASLAVAGGLPGPRWASFAGMAYNAGAVIGYAGLGFVADAIGRKPTTLIYVAGALVMVPIQFLTTHDLGLLLAIAAVTGLFSSGQYTWMSAWLPELFPTRMRATGAGFVFNAPRLIAWIGPLIAGTLITNFGGFGHAALAVGSIYILGLVAAALLPETRGQPLPESI